MKPYKYTQRGSVTKFHYKYSELKDFIKEGKEHGANGMILIERENDVVIHRGFGVIDNLWTYIMTLEQVWNEPLFGKFPTNDEIINPPITSQPLSSYKILILDVTKNDTSI